MIRPSTPCELARSKADLDAATLVLEVGMSTLDRQAGDKLRGRRLWWR